MDQIRTSRKLTLETALEIFHCSVVHPTIQNPWTFMNRNFLGTWVAQVLILQIWTDFQALMSYQKINIQSRISQQEQRAHTDRVVRNKKWPSTRNWKYIETFWLFSDVWSGDDINNNVNDSYTIQLFSSSIPSFASKPHDSALSNSLKSYIELPVEYLHSKMFSCNCTRKQTLFQHKRSESPSAGRKCSKNFSSRTRDGVVLPWKWEKLDVLKLHLYQ